MRRLTIFAALSIFSFGIVHCVADEPATGSGNTDDGGNSGGDSTTSGGDSSTGGDGSTTNTDGSTPPNDACIGNTNCPTAIDAAVNLKLWLRGNVGVTCTAGRVASWVDQSAGGNNAVPEAFGPPKFNTALAPHCGTATIAGHNVVTFTAPAQDAGAGAPFLDETLRLPMTWLMNTEYTIFVVHRRAADHAFGLLAQDDDVLKLCNPSPGGYSFPQAAFAFGFEAPIDGGTGDALYYAQHCIATGTERGPLGQAASTFSAGTVDVDEVVFAFATGHQLYANGALVFSGEASNNEKQAVIPYDITDAAAPGYVGRASEDAVDTRFQGDIAEVIGFAQALSDTQRGEIETYLKAQWGLSF